MTCFRPTYWALCVALGITLLSPSRAELKNLRGLQGEKCVVQDYVGFGLQNEDNLMILKNCGDPLALINHFPQGGQAP